MKKCHPFVIFLFVMVLYCIEMIALTEIYVNARKSVVGALIILVVFLYGNAWWRKRAYNMQKGATALSTSDIIFSAVNLCAYIALFIACKTA